MRRLRRLTAVAALAALCVVVAERTAETHNPVTTTVLFNKEIAPIIFTKCAPCHFEGGPSMSLLTFDEVRPWAQAIKEEVLLRQMPPWPAKHGYGAFANDMSLTTREREFLLAWLDGGTPAGDDPAPQHFDHSAHWMLGSPDDVRVAVPEKASPRHAGVRRFIVDTGFQTAQFVRAVDIKVDRRHTRAVFMSLLETGQYLGGWSPGHGAIELPPRVAFRLPAGARLALDVIEDPQGAGGEPPQVGIYLTEKPDAAIVRPLKVVGRVAEGEQDVRIRHRLAAAQTLVGLRVEPVAGAKSVQLVARRPDGSIEPLLWTREGADAGSVPFVFKEPVELPVGTTLDVATDFDHIDPKNPAQVVLHFTAYDRSE